MRWLPVIDGDFLDNYWSSAEIGIAPAGTIWLVQRTTVQNNYWDIQVELKRLHGDSWDSVHELSMYEDSWNGEIDGNWLPLPASYEEAHLIAERVLSAMKADPSTFDLTAMMTSEVL